MERARGKIEKVLRGPREGRGLLMPLGENHREI